MKILYMTIVVSLGFVFAGCGASQPQAIKKVKQLPKWIDAPMQNDIKYMYGFAIEEDRELAIKAALSDMVAKLGTTIESSFTSEQVVDGFYNNTRSQNKIKSQTSNIKINNYEIYKSHRISYKQFAVIVQTNKKKFVNALLDKVEIDKKRMNTQLLSIQNQDVVTRYNGLAKLQRESDILLSNVLIVEELKSSLSKKRAFSKKQYLNFVAKIKESFEHEQKSLSFCVCGDKKSSGFISVIKKYLLEKDLNVISVKKSNSLHVLVNTNQYIKSGIAVLKVNVKVTNNSQALGEKIFNMKERYNGSKESLYKNATIHFEQDTQKKTITELLGVNLKLK